jgi:hypothetical protein
MQRNPTEDESTVLSAADFTALRHLHAKQAAYLGTKHWKTPEGELNNLKSSPGLAGVAVKV